MPSITELQQRLNALEQEKALVRSKLSEQRRKDATKQKILVGGAVIAAARSDRGFRDAVVPVLQAAAASARSDADRSLIQAVIDGL